MRLTQAEPTSDVTVLYQKSTKWPVAQILGKHHKLTVTLKGVDFCDCLPSDLAKKGLQANRCPGT